MEGIGIPQRLPEQRIRPLHNLGPSGLDESDKLVTQALVSLDALVFCPRIGDIGPDARGETGERIGFVEIMPITTRKR